MEMSLLTFKTSVKMATFFLYNWNHSQYKNTNLCTYSAVKKDLLPYIFFNNKNDDYYCIFGKQSYLDSSVVMAGRV